MAQIINDMDLGSMLGRQLGTGISKGLGTLAQYKMQDIIKRQTRDAYENMRPGMGWLAELHPSVQKSFMEDMFAMHPEMFDNPNTITQETLQDFKPYQNAIQQVPPTLEMYPQPGQTNADQYVSDILQGQIGTGMPQMGPGAQMLKDIETQRQYYPPQDMSRTLKNAPTTKRYSAPAGLSVAQRGKYIQDVLKEERVREREDIKESRLAKKDINEKYKAAVESNKRLERMKELIEGKKLSRPRAAALVNLIKAKGYGLDLSSFLTEESQEYEKLLQGFLPNAKAMFGAKMTDTDLREFMKGMPDLMKSREGKRRMIYNMKILNDTAILRGKVANKIIEEHGGRVPSNLEKLIDKRAEKQLSGFADKLREGFKKAPKKEKTPKSFLGKGPMHVFTKLADFAFGKG